MKYSIVILSKTAENLIACVNAIRDNDITAPIIVVWDAPEDDPAAAVISERSQPFDAGVSFEKGIKPFVFARNANIGIRAAGTDDVILLNDDAILQTRGGFDMMAEACSSLEHFGAVSALIWGMAAAEGQQGTREKISYGNAHPLNVLEVSHHMIAFMAVYFRRAALEQCGELDERFTGYGYEDDDYCKRLKLLELKLGVHCGCLVDHGTLPSSFRGAVPAGINLLDENRLIFKDKWEKWNLEGATK